VWSQGPHESNFTSSCSIYTCQKTSQVLATLTALLAGNGSSRVRLRADVGYDTLLHMVLRQAGPAGPQQRLLLATMGPVLEVCNKPSTCITSNFASNDAFISLVGLTASMLQDRVCAQFLLLNSLHTQSINPASGQCLTWRMGMRPSSL